MPDPCSPATRARVPSDSLKLVRPACHRKSTLHSSRFPLAVSASRTGGEAGGAVCGPRRRYRVPGVQPRFFPGGTNTTRCPRRRRGRPPAGTGCRDRRLARLVASPRRARSGSSELAEHEPRGTRPAVEGHEEPVCNPAPRRGSFCWELVRRDLVRFDSAPRFCVCSLVPPTAALQPRRSFPRIPGRNLAERGFKHRGCGHSMTIFHRLAADAFPVNFLHDGGGMIVRLPELCPSIPSSSFTKIPPASVLHP